MAGTHKKVNLTSSDLSASQLEQLRRILPEVFREGQIDWEELRAVLGETVDTRIEKFSFTWAGKGKAVENVLKPSKATLRPDEKESVKFNESENIFIEGDNLEVLKLLQKAYFEKVKMIYIDPPYNTGGDFVYKDNFAAPLQNYLKQTGQKNGNGEHLTTNKETSGRFHSDWLTMMYPRLKLAWSLLKEDGFIFVSIDDNEVHHLRMLMDEVFGEENFVGTITWEKRTKAQNTETARAQFQSKTEYIVLYKKNPNRVSFNLEITGAKTYDKTDEKGNYRLKVVEEMSTLGMRGRPTMVYPILEVNPRDGFQWKVGIETVRAYQERGDVEIIEGKPYFRVRPDDENLETFSPFWSHFFDKDTYGTAETGKSELSEILDTEAHGFETVKPVGLLQKLIFHTTNSDEGDIILDFFAGSGTTAHAVLAQNNLDNGNRKFVLVQLPEKLEEDSPGYKAGFKTVLDICKLRIKNVLEKVSPEKGFKFFKLGESNYPENQFEFDPDKSEDENQEAYEQYLVKAGQNKLLETIDESDIIYENIIKEGFSLNSHIAVGAKGTNKIYTVTDGSRQFSICLDRHIDDGTITLLMEWAKDITFICFDNALDDTAKANLGLHLELKTI